MSDLVGYQIRHTQNVGDVTMLESIDRRLLSVQHDRCFSCEIHHSFLGINGDILHN